MSAAEASNDYALDRVRNMRFTESVPPFARFLENEPAFHEGALTKIEKV